MIYALGILAITFSVGLYFLYIDLKSDLCCVCGVPVTKNNTYYQDRITEDLTLCKE